MDWSEVSNQVVQLLIPIVVAAVGTMVTLGLRALNKWVAAKTHNEDITNILDPLSEVISANVSAVEQEVRKYMADGKLSKEEYASLKRDAIDRITAQAPQLIESLGRIGLAKAEDFIGAKIEEIILSRK